MGGLLREVRRTLTVMEPITVRRMGSNDWRLWRELRLAALADAPEAFASTLARELAFDEEAWRDRMRGPGVNVMAFADQQAVGIAATFVPDSTAVPELVSMWVRPEWRGRHVGAGLVDEVLGWACQGGYAEVRLFVMDGNSAALRLYENTGFVLTGETQVLQTEGRPVELRMVHRLLRGEVSPLR
jgi:RimJ/RimL family protein N-acetyltransferase